MNCIECRQLSKYKCPTCRQPYCSVPCCKKHKLSPCSAPPSSPPSNMIPEESSVHYEFPTEDTVPYEKLKLLEQSETLKECLINPHLRELLKTLDSSSHPDALVEEYMQYPIFTEFVDACLKVIQPQEDPA